MLYVFTPICKKNLTHNFLAPYHAAATSLLKLHVVLCIILELGWMVPSQLQTNKTILRANHEYKVICRETVSLILFDRIL